MSYIVVLGVYAKATKYDAAKVQRLNCAEIRATKLCNLSRDIVAFVALQVAERCCSYFHPRQVLSTFCNKIFQSATIFFVARQVARFCCAYFRSLKNYDLLYLLNLQSLFFHV